MKKLLLLSAIALIAFSCSQNTHQINGNLANLTGEVVLTFSGDESNGTLTTIVENGAFQFNYDKQHQGFITLAQKGNLIPFATVLVDLPKYEIAITGDSNNPKEVTVIGSVPNNLLIKFTEDRLFGDKGKMVQAIIANPNSIISAYILKEMSVYSSLSELYKYKKVINQALHNTAEMKAVDKRISMMERVAIGQKFIDIKLPNPEGKVIVLSELLKKNKYVLIDFWASWCSPCRKENVNILKAYNQFNERGFTVYAVSLDNPKQKNAWIQAIKDDGLTWTNVSDLKGWQCAPAKEYAVMGIPANFLISSDGTIVGVDLKGNMLTNKLNELLK